MNGLEKTITICIAAILITLVVSVTACHVSTTRMYITGGYTQRVLPGQTSASWVKDSATTLPVEK